MLLLWGQPRRTVPQGTGDKQANEPLRPGALCVSSSVRQLFSAGSTLLGPIQLHHNRHLPNQALCPRSTASAGAAGSTGACWLLQGRRTCHSL